MRRTKSTFADALFNDFVRAVFGFLAIVFALVVYYVELPMAAEVAALGGIVASAYLAFRGLM